MHRVGCIEVSEKKARLRKKRIEKGNSNRKVSERLETKQTRFQVLIVGIEPEQVMHGSTVEFGRRYSENAIREEGKRNKLKLRLNSIEFKFELRRPNGK